MVRQAVQLDVDDITSLFLFPTSHSAFMVEARRIAGEKGVPEQQVIDAFREIEGVDKAISFVVGLPLLPIIEIRRRVGSLMRRFGV